MKKWIAGMAALAVLTLGAGPGRAEGTDLSGYSVASGNVAAVSFEDLTAPWSGTLLPFDWAAGDAVEAGQEMFTLRTETVYAPENGTVKTVFAAPGENAAAVSLRYGAALFLEGEHPDRIQATTAGAFQKRENKIIQMGETLYFRSDKAGREEGSGRVIQVSSGGYLVEILEGSFEMGENLSLFRKEDYSANAKVGMGQVSRRDPVPVTGQGRIREILVEAGDRVIVINSANLSTGIGLLVIEAAIMAEVGRSGQEIKEYIDQLKPLVRSSFVVDTMTYLHRGGRCSSVAALAGSALKLHPEIIVEDGAMHVGKKYRGKMDKVIEKYVRDKNDDLRKARRDRIFITHSGCGEEIIESIRSQLEELDHFDEILVTRAGGVISSHCGPGTLGVLFIAGE